MLALTLCLTFSAVPDDYVRVRDEGNKAGVFAYTGWSALTLGTGIVGISTTHDPAWQGAHIAHLLFGGVNLAIAAVSIITTYRARPDPEHPLAEGRNAQLAYAINAIFDMATLTASVAIWKGVPDARWQGFAVAALFQSAWLLAYDVTMALYHQLNNARAAD